MNSEGNTDLTPANPLGSDKHYWHRYLDSFYPKIFANRNISAVAEFGTYRGDSVRWLQSMLPEARIWSFDILEASPEWPISESVFYETLDQGDRRKIRQVFEKVSKKFDLIIEDGSHKPEHQRNCLFESIDFMAPGGVYVIEDIHTSMEELRYAGLVSPAGLGYRRVRRQLARTGSLHKVSSFVARQVEGLFSVSRERIMVSPCGNLLSLVLAIERSKAIGRSLSALEIEQLAEDGFMSANEITRVVQEVKEVLIYRRDGLPLACHRCLGTNFHYGTLRCECGTRIYKDDDSMAAALFF